MKFQISTYFDENWYVEGFGIGDYESIVTFPKYNMADPIWQPEVAKGSLGAKPTVGVGGEIPWHKISVDR